MSELESIRAALQDRNLAEVARRTGISRVTLTKIKSGNVQQVRLDKWEALRQYLRDTSFGAERA